MPILISFSMFINCTLHIYWGYNPNCDRSTLWRCLFRLQLLWVLFFFGWWGEGLGLYALLMLTNPIITNSTNKSLTFILDASRDDQWVAYDTPRSGWRAINPLIIHDTTYPTWIFHYFSFPTSKSYGPYHLTYIQVKKFFQYLSLCLLSYLLNYTPSIPC